MDLEGHTVGSFSSENTDESSTAADSSTEDIEETISESNNDYDGISLYARLSGLYLGATIRTMIRAIGVLAVLAGGYHLLVPLLGVDVPIIAPWRVIGVVWMDGPGIGNTPMFVGDVILICVGAATAWFV